MHFFSQLLNPGIINLLALLLSVVWMLRDDKDRARPILVFALVLNLLYSWAFYVVLVQENALVPWKFDHVLASLDDALGVTTAMIAVPLQGAWRLPLGIVYQMIIPMMIVWYFVNKPKAGCGSVVLAYVAELSAGLPLYALLPACGPIYAFHSEWLHPPAVQAEAVRFSGMPNAFPSLHLATAVIFVLRPREILAGHFSGNAGRHRISYSLDGRALCDRSCGWNRIRLFCRECGIPAGSKRSLLPGGRSGLVSRGSVWL